MDDHEKSDETGEQNEIGGNEAVDENETSGNGTGRKVAKAAGMVAGMTTGAATVASVSTGGAFAVPGMGMGVATGAAGVTTGSALAAGAVIGTGVGVIVASAVVVAVKVGGPFLRGFRSGWHWPGDDTLPDGDPTPGKPSPTRPAAAAALAASQPIGVAAEAA